MCLTTLTSKQIDNFEGEGWKVVSPSENENEFRFPIYNLSPFNPYYNTWIERKENLICFPDTSITSWRTTNSYPAGFHIFTTKEDAENYKKSFPATFVVKVKYKTILAKGIQDGLLCIVAQFLYVEKPECA